MRTTERMVEQEIICNVSHLVATLAGGNATLADVPSDLSDLMSQAFELASPIDDWEEAARDAVDRYPGRFIDPSEATTDPRGFCDLHEIDPYQREVFEHWFVTDWFADRLEAKGEKVDKDFAAHCVWARTTTGQGIASDSVVQAIHADLEREYGE